MKTNNISPWLTFLFLISCISLSSAFLFNESPNVLNFGKKGTSKPYKLQIESATSKTNLQALKLDNQYPLSRSDDILSLPLHEVPPKLLQIVDRPEENITIITEGYITHKRSFGSSLAFIDLIGSNELKGSQPLQMLVKRQDYQHERSKSVFSSILKSFYPGTKISIEGVASLTRNPGEVVLLAKHIRFLKSSRNPEHIKGMLQRFNMYLETENTQSSSSNSDEPGQGAKRTRTGLAIEEFGEVFGPEVDIMKLKACLQGQEDAEFLFCDGGQNSATTMTSKKEDTHFKKKIAYAKIARLIVNHLPEDEKYPSIILNLKGSATNRKSNAGTARLASYSALPTAPKDVMTTPSIIETAISTLGTCASEKDDDIEETYQSSIINLLMEEHEKSFANDTVKAKSSEEPRLLAVAGWVQNRRRFKGDCNSSITVLELVDEPASDISTPGKLDRLKCVLHPDCFQRNENGIDSDNSIILPTDAYGNLMSKGGKALLKGYYRIEDDGRPTLWVTKARLERCSWRPATIKYFLDLIAGSEETGRFSFDMEEIASSLDIGHMEATDLIEFCKKSGATERQWRAAELSRELQDSTSRSGHFSDEMKLVLEENSNARNDYPLEKIESEDFVDVEVLPTLRRQKYLRKSSEGSRWRGKKKPQLEFMGQQVKKVVESHPDFGSRSLNILDVGGGRGFLANYLSSILGDDIVNVHVIDIDSNAIRNGQTDADRRGLNVRFGAGDASSSSNVALLLENDENPSRKNTFDIVVALHACGALTDVALGHALTNEAGFVITPCCFRSNSFLQVPLDDIEVKPSEFLQMDEQAMVDLTQAAEIQGDINVSGEAIHTICALRARAVKSRFASKRNRSIDIQLKTFPIGFSTRNYCMVGCLEQRPTE